MAVSFPNLRMRRLRRHPLLRDLVREIELNLKDLVFPLFIKEMEGPKKAVETMPGIYQLPIAAVQEEIEELIQLGINSIMLFGIPSHKDAVGSDSCHEQGIIQQAIRKIREISPTLLIMSDICFCEYTDHGHCGFISHKRGQWELDNDETLSLLAKQAVSHARAGIDVLAPSGMIDGVVQAIRQGLDEAGFEHLPILSHSVKYNSSMYGPFRAASEGPPRFGDRSSYQVDCANGAEALREVELDVEEGVDMLMVKPAHGYLDVIYRVKQAYPHIPLGAYHVSGEYSMIKAAAEKGWIDEKKVTLEILRGIRRAGADFVITYYAKEVAQWHKEGVW